MLLERFGLRQSCWKWRNEREEEEAAEEKKKGEGRRRRRRRWWWWIRKKKRTRKKKEKKKHHRHQQMEWNRKEETCKNLEENQKRSWLVHCQPPDANQLPRRKLQIVHFNRLNRLELILRGVGGRRGGGGMALKVLQNCSDLPDRTLAPFEVAY